MTIGNVVRNYLRWFELNRYKKELERAPEALARIAAVAGENTENRTRQTTGNAQSIDFVDPLA